MWGRKDPKEPVVPGHQEKGSTTKGKIVLRLYVTDMAPNSIQAIANVHQICEEYNLKEVDLQIIDIFENPQQALSDSILVSPTLVKVSPPPKRIILGDLRDKERVAEIINIGEATYD
jgi:circadian clock protein KaiB